MGYQKVNPIMEQIETIDRLEVLQNCPLNHLPFDYWLKKSKQELMQFYMNAMVTTSCLGHWKAERNEGRVKYYGELMAKYKVPKPSQEVAYLLGNFNGKGSV
jgi:hypothetical protein